LVDSFKYIISIYSSNPEFSWLVTFFIIFSAITLVLFFSALGISFLKIFSSKYANRFNSFVASVITGLISVYFYTQLPLSPSIGKEPKVKTIKPVSVAPNLSAKEAVTRYLSVINIDNDLAWEMFKNYKSSRITKKEFNSKWIKSGKPILYEEIKEEKVSNIRSNIELFIGFSKYSKKSVRKSCYVMLKNYNGGDIRFSFWEFEEDISCKKITTSNAIEVTPKNIYQMSAKEATKKYFSLINNDNELAWQMFKNYKTKNISQKVFNEGWIQLGNPIIFGEIEEFESSSVSAIIKFTMGFSNHRNIENKQYCYRLYKNKESGNIHFNYWEFEKTANCSKSIYREDINTFSIQLIAVNDESKAIELFNIFIKEGYNNVYIQNENSFYKVRFGSYLRKYDAEKMQNDLKRKYQKNPLIQNSRIVKE